MYVEDDDYSDKGRFHRSNVLFQVGKKYKYLEKYAGQWFKVRGTVRRDGGLFIIEGENKDGTRHLWQGQVRGTSEAVMLNCWRAILDADYEYKE